MKLNSSNPYLKYGFVPVPHLVACDRTLSAGARLTYGHLIWLMQRGQTYPGHETAGAMWGLSPRSLKRYINELKAMGLLHAQTRPGRPTVIVLVDPHDAHHGPTWPTGQAKLAHQPGQSGPPTRGDPIEDTRSRGDTDSALESLIRTIHGNLCPREPLAPVRSHLTKYSPAQLRRAFAITQDREPRNPIAYMYRVLQRMVHPETQPADTDLTALETQRSDHDHDPPPPAPPSPDEAHIHAAVLRHYRHQAVIKSGGSKTQMIRRHGQPCDCESCRTERHDPSPETLRAVIAAAKAELHSQHPEEDSP
jgi:hypothetical protein